MSRTILVTLPGGGPERSASSCEDCPFRSWDHLVERSDFGATSRMRGLCTNPSFEMEGQARSLDEGRLAECIAAETAAADLGDALDTLRALVLLGIEDRMAEIEWTPDEFVRHPEITEAYDAEPRRRAQGGRASVDAAPVLRRALEILRRAGR